MSALPPFTAPDMGLPIRYQPIPTTTQKFPSFILKIIGLLTKLNFLIDHNIRFRKSNFCKFEILISLDWKMNVLCATAMILTLTYSLFYIDQDAMVIPICPLP